MEIPAQYLALALVALAAYYVDDNFNNGRLFAQLQGLVGGRRHKARPGMNFKGVPIAEIEEVGTVIRKDSVGTQRELMNLNLYTPEGTNINIDEDEIHYPRNILYKNTVGPIDLESRADECVRLKGQIAYLGQQVQTYQTEAANVWKTRPDLAKELAELMGIMRKDIGSTQIITGGKGAAAKGQGGEEHPE